jgi:type I restriction enzyme, S subunit
VNLRMKQVCQSVGQYGANIPASEYVNDGIRFLRTTDIKEDGNLTDPELGVYVTEEMVPDHILENGDLLFSRSGTLGRAYLHSTQHDSPTHSFAGYLVRFRPALGVHPDFIFYASRSASFLSQIDADAIQTTIANFNAEKYGNISLWLPPLPTQKAIADFLDKKTAAIDALIEKKQKLLTLLAEKRAALINQAVTKGLDPNVPMKDSGVPWIEEIPAHWHTRKLRYIARRLQGRLIVQPHLYFAEEGVPIVFGYNIKDGIIDEDGLSRVNFTADAAHPHARVRAGDLLTVRLGDPGMTAVVPPSLDGCHFASIMWVHQHPQADSHWLCHAMNSCVVQGQIDAANYGATLSQFNIADAVDWVLPFPPKEEQVEIATFLTTQRARLKRLETALTKEVEVLGEYRQALITAAVIGQLDIGEAA